MFSAAHRGRVMLGVQARGPHKGRVPAARRQAAEFGVRRAAIRAQTVRCVVLLNVSYGLVVSSTCSRAITAVQSWTNQTSRPCRTSERVMQKFKLWQTVDCVVGGIYYKADTHDGLVRQRWPAPDMEQPVR